MSEQETRWPRFLRGFRHVWWQVALNILLALLGFLLGMLLCLERYYE